MGLANPMVNIYSDDIEAATRVDGLAVAPGSHGFQLVVWTDDVDAPPASHVKVVNLRFTR